MFVTRLYWLGDVESHQKLVVPCWKPVTTCSGDNFGSGSCGGGGGIGDGDGDGGGALTGRWTRTCWVPILAKADSMEKTDAFIFLNFAVVFGWETKAYLF